MDKTELSVIFLGFGIVFTVLAILFFVMVVMNLVSKAGQKKNPAIVEPTLKAATPPAQISRDDDTELAAAITAVLAAAMDVPVSAVKLTNFYEQTAHPTQYIVNDPWNPAGRIIPAWNPTYKNTDGGNRDEKLYSKDKWKNV